MNDQIFFIFYNLAHKSIFFDSIIYFFAETLPYLTILAAGIFFILDSKFSLIEPYFSKHSVNNLFKTLKEKSKDIIVVFFSVTLSLIFSFLIKLLTQVERPFNTLQEVYPVFRESGFAFPSMHSALFMALAFSIYFIHKRFGYFFILIAFLIGISRISAGVHYPIDILGGFVLGVITAYFVKFLYVRVNK